MATARLSICENTFFGVTKKVFGSLSRGLVHPTAPVLLTSNGPIGGFGVCSALPKGESHLHGFGVWESAKARRPRARQPLSLHHATPPIMHHLFWGTLRWEPATNQLDWSFAPMLKFDDRFARQNRFGLPPSVNSASPYSSIARWFSGCRLCTLPRQSIG